jgi:adenylosuccinate lyase
MLYQNFFYSPQVDTLFTNEATIGYMLQFESALAQAQAKHGMIPQNVADIISKICVIENIDIQLLISQVGLGGNACIPLIKQLTNRKRFRKSHTTTSNFIRKSPKNPHDWEVFFATSKTHYFWV